MRGRLPRATTQAQKDERKQSILSAADQHLIEVGLDAFSMEVLARELGYARGTLYRYFGTREEVLLDLYNLKRSDWVLRLLNTIKPGLSDKIFVRRHYTESVKDALFLTLRARLESTIIPNISAAKHAESREVTASSIGALAQHYSECLGLTERQAQQLIIAYGALMLGAAQVEPQSTRKSSRLTKEMRELVTDMDGQTVFESNGIMILEGLRGDRSIPSRSNPGRSER
ncbi:MAG: helix-turn-helix domain-containing protein [Pseudomonadota bacterium]